jgi:hypothetical protein
LRGIVKKPIAEFLLEENVVFSFGLGRAKGMKGGEFHADRV